MERNLMLSKIFSHQELRNLPREITQKIEKYFEVFSKEYLALRNSK